jgi:hypothetical protein
MHLTYSKTQSYKLFSCMFIERLENILKKHGRFIFPDEGGKNDPSGSEKFHLGLMFQ